jgi:hypothetical protein
MLLIKGATIGHPKSVGVVPETWSQRAIINGSIYKFGVRPPHDPYYVCAFFRTRFGLIQKVRAIANTGISYNDQQAIRDFVVPLPPPEVQQAIGAKMRRAAELKACIGALIHSSRRDVESLLDGTLDTTRLLAEGRDIQLWLDHDQAARKGSEDARLS